MKNTLKTLFTLFLVSTFIFSFVIMATASEVAKYEAEDAILFGPGAIMVEDAESASGGKIVTRMASHPDNGIRFENVAAGTTLEIVYAQGFERQEGDTEDTVHYLYVTVGSNDPVTVEFPYTGSWDSIFEAATLDVTINAGDTITLQTHTQYEGVNIDYIRILDTTEPVASAPEEGTTTTPTQAPVQTNPGDAGFWLIAVTSIASIATAGLVIKKRKI